MPLICRRTVFSAFVAGLIALPLAGFAHSTKEATDPADGAVLIAAPEVITMAFDAPMRVTMITLTDRTGAGHALTRDDAMQPVIQFRAEPPVLPVGHYTVEWRGLAEDGHAMQGRFSFEIRD